MTQLIKLQDLEDYEIISTPGGQIKKPTDSFLGQTIRNIPGSALRFGKDIFQTIRHPIETAKGLGSIAAGGLEKLIPGKQKQEQQFENLTKFFKERYGGTENIKKTIQEDPVGFLADVSAILTGGGAATARLGGKLGQIGRITQKAGLVAEPLNLGLRGTGIITYPFRKVGGVLAKESLGVSTGVGGQVIETAFKNPSREFTQALRGKTTVDNLLTGARDALQTIKEQRAGNYRASLVAIKESQKPINILPLKNFVDNQLVKFNIKIKKDGNLDMSKSVIADKTEQSRISTIVNETKNWKDNTPAGLDILKQRLDDFYTPSGRGRALTNSIRGKLKNTLDSEVSGYREMTKEYAEATNLIKEIEDTLSLKQGAKTDTTIRKLTSSLRQNNEYRQVLVEKLDSLTQRDLVAGLAGAALAPGVPAGLIGRSIFAGGLTGGLAGAFGLAAISPKILAGLVLTSPRVVGEMLRVLGMSNKAIQSFTEFIKSPRGRELLQIQFQAGRLQKFNDLLTKQNIQ